MCVVPEQGAAQQLRWAGREEDGRTELGKLGPI